MAHASGPIESDIQAEPPSHITYPTGDVATTADKDFFQPLLELVLAKTQAEYGKTVLSAHEHSLSSARILYKLKHRAGIDVVWTTTSSTRERDFLHIPISLLRELNDYHVLLVRKDKKDLLKNVTNKEDLRQFRFGVGGHWPEATFFADQGFFTVKSIYYNSLFKMLSLNRFDVFSRGLFEIEDDLQTFQFLDIAMDEHLLLYYPAPFYFFVHKDNKKLAARLALGLKRAQEDGSYDALLMSIPAFKKAFELLNNPSRRTIILSPLTTIQLSNPRSAKETVSPLPTTT